MDDGHQKRLETLSIETEAQKKKLVVELKRTPIVQIACKKLGIGRSTYYKWRFQDHIFAKACDQAMEFGSALINDIVESKLISMAQNSNLEAMKFWLRHNHNKYSLVTKNISPFSLASLEPSIEAMHESRATISRNIVHKLINKISPNEVKSSSKEVETELMVNDEIDRIKINDYLEDED